MLIRRSESYKAPSFYFALGTTPIMQRNLTKLIGDDFYGKGHRENQ